jgi:hypothetical protein
VTTPTGQAIAGNVGSLAPGVMDTRAGPRPPIAGLTSRTPPITARWCASLSCPAASGCLIGRDLEERRRLFGIVAKAAQWSILIVVVLGLGGGIFVRGGCCGVSTP